jgi:hypothetical protein
LVSTVPVLVVAVALVFLALVVGLALTVRSKERQRWKARAAALRSSHGAESADPRIEESGPTDDVLDGRRRRDT